MAEKIALLGCGFMAGAIAKGLIENSVIPAENIIAINAHNPSSAENFAAKYGTSFGLAEAVAEADAVITCFKPQNYKTAMPEYARHMHPGQLLISIMAGLTTRDIKSLLPEGVDVIRTMPNMALAVGLSATGYSPQGATPEHKALCEKIFGSLGIISEVPEEDLTGVTAIAGSSPAYFYYLAECMIKAAVEAGMDENAAKMLCKQAFIGTAELWKNDDAPPDEMRRRITSAKGTTDAAIRTMEAGSMANIVAEGMKACRERFVEMGIEMMK